MKLPETIPHRSWHRSGLHKTRRPQAQPVSFCQVRQWLRASPSQPTSRVHDAAKCHFPCSNLPLLWKRGRADETTWCGQEAANELELVPENPVGSREAPALFVFSLFTSSHSSQTTSISQFPVEACNIPQASTVPVPVPDIH